MRRYRRTSGSRVVAVAAIFGLALLVAAFAALVAALAFLAAVVAVVAFTAAVAGAILFAASPQAFAARVGDLRSRALSLPVTRWLLLKRNDH